MKIKIDQAKRRVVLNWLMRGEIDTDEMQELQGKGNRMLSMTEAKEFIAKLEKEY